MSLKLGRGGVAAEDPPCAAVLRAVWTSDGRRACEQAWDGVPLRVYYQTSQSVPELQPTAQSSAKQQRGRDLEAARHMDIRNGNRRVGKHWGHFRAPTLLRSYLTG